MAEIVKRIMQSGMIYLICLRNVNEIRPTYAPEFKKIFGNNFSN